MHAQTTDTMRHPRHRGTLGFVAALCGCLTGGLLPVASAVAAEATTPYAVVEIGAKGVKGYLFDMDRAARDPACSVDNDAYLKCIAPVTLPQNNCNPLTDVPEFKDTAKAVQGFMDDFTKQGIPANHIYIVGSSSLGDGLRHDLLEQQIAKLVTPTPANPLGFVNVVQESEFGFKGVLGMLPERWRRIRTLEAVTIDIGSGNTKGAFQTSAGPLVDFSVNFGTRSATQAIKAAQQKPDSLRKAADGWRLSVLEPQLHSEIDNKQAIASRNRVYLIGGAVWALATHTHPEDSTSKFPRIDAKSIDVLMDRALSSNAEEDLCNDARKRKYPEVGKVCETFNPEQLVGGLTILKALSEQLGFASNHKVVFFFRDSLYAWPLGYIADKLQVRAPEVHPVQKHPS